MDRVPDNLLMSLYFIIIIIIIIITIIITITIDLVGVQKDRWESSDTS